MTRLFCVLLPFLFLSWIVSAQKQTDLISIPGKIKSIEIVQDDISFYTWSLYIVLDVNDSWDSPPIDMPEINLKSKPIFYESCDTSMDSIKFSRHGFHNEKDARSFYTKSKKGKKITLKIEVEDWENYVKGKKCLLYIVTTSKYKK